jgi:hypothetical protein
MKPKPPFKTENNVWYTQALFWEHVINKPIDQRLFEPVFSLYDDKPGLINCRKTFVELGDPTGYKWAIRYLGDYEHWKRLVKCSWFQEAYDVWMNELKMKLQSEALDTIRDISQGENPAQALVASKYLASFEWEKKGRGRPSKEEVQGELKHAARVLSEEDKDFERIQLKVVK